MSGRNFAPSRYVMSSGASISLLNESSFEMAVGVAGPNDPLLGRYQEKILNKPKKIRACGRCNCVGHTRKNCIIYRSRSGPRRLDEESLRRERDEVQEIMRRTQKKPTTRNMYMVKHVRSMKPEMRQRLSAYDQFLYVDHKGFDPVVYDAQDNKAIYRAIHGYEINHTPLTGICFTVPENTQVGDVLSIRSQTGVRHRIIAQKGLRPGTFTTIAVPLHVRDLPSNVPPAGEAPVQRPTIPAQRPTIPVQRPTIPVPANVPEAPSNDEPESDDVFDESSCPICMDPLTNRNKLVSKCGHQFHASCIMTWLSGPRSACSNCPTCRNSMF